jgi:unsaturated chondroitin disaccharide hydrolase
MNRERAQERGARREPKQVEAIWEAYLAAARREFEQSLGRAENLFPHFTEGPRWRLLPIETTSRWLDDGVYEHGNWTAGFWFGVMWLLAMGSGHDEALAVGRERLQRLVPRAEDSTTHDLGFLFFPSFVLGLQLGFLTPEAARPAVRAARLTARRLDQAGGFVQAFGPIGDPRSAGTSTIDTMMNLPLLWWAGPRASDEALWDAARLHARTSARTFVREDGSTYHLNRFDPASGALEHRGTFQGASEASCWSRGQAWGISGFAWAYAAMGDEGLLAAAERTAAYFWDRLPEDGIPPWDFSDQSENAERDASASAIAALGALILGRIHPDERERDAHWSRGLELLGLLGESCLNTEEGREGILLRSCYSKPHSLGLNSATAWGDFFFGLALALAIGHLSLDRMFGFRLAAPRTATGDAPTT